MKRSTTTRIFIAVGIVAAVTGIAVPAHASVFQNGFDVEMGAIQSPVYTEPDVQALASNDGRVHTAAIGADYKADAVMCEITYACDGGTKVYGLDDGGYAWLENNYAAGTNPRMELRSNGQNFTTNIQVQGWWFSG